LYVHVFNIIHVTNRADPARAAHKVNRWVDPAMTIREYLLGQDSFDPADIEAMSAALDAVCAELNFPPTARGVRQFLADRIIGLVRRGEKDPARLRDRVLSEANLRRAGGSPH
jgi:hypothetical protein